MTTNRGSQKHEREAVRKLEKLVPGMRAWIELRRGATGHKWLCVQVGETTVRLVMSSSPSNAEHAFQHLRQQCSRALRERGVAV